MKKKIIITGGLGYIGTELCKLYSGLSWHHNISVIDNRFISERVNQIRNWNINFIQGDILDKEMIKKYCSDEDIIHHLTGVTDVPRTKSEASNEKNKKLKEDHVEELRKCHDDEIKACNTRITEELENYKTAHQPQFNCRVCKALYPQCKKKGLW